MMKIFARAVRTTVVSIGLLGTLMGENPLGELLWAAENSTQVSRPCEIGQEAWTFSDRIPEETRTLFRDSLEEKNSLFEPFLQGYRLREVGLNLESRVLGDYWMSRSLFQAKQVHLAHAAFLALASQDYFPETLGIQFAALGCLVQIELQTPSLGWSRDVLSKLTQVPVAKLSPGNREIFTRAVYLMAREAVGKDDFEERQKILMLLLPGSSPFESAAKGILSLRKQDFAAASTELQKVTTQEASDPLLKEHLDFLTLLLGRALYTQKKYVAAAEVYRKVSRGSNHFAAALVELSWSLLMSGKYREAIGAAFNLQKSVLRGSFSPEGPMVMAISFNELCQFAQAIQAIQYFRKVYKEGYQWLYSWYQKPNRDLYGLLSEVLRTSSDSKSGKSEKGGKPSVPKVVSSEWVRSPVFLASQEEINLIQDTRKISARLLKLSTQGTAIDRKALPKLKLEVSKYLSENQELARKRNPRIDLKARKSRLLDLRNRVLELELRLKAQQLWSTSLRAFHKRSRAMEQELVTRINLDLFERNQRMIRSIVKATENTELIEVEIYEGASEDLVWRNSHPDYQKVTSDFRKADEKKETRKVPVWRWGGVSIDDEEGEVWEDELGWYSGELDDECSNKNRYIKLKGKTEK